MILTEVKIFKGFVNLVCLGNSRVYYLKNFTRNSFSLVIILFCLAKVDHNYLGGKKKKKLFSGFILHKIKHIYRSQINKYLRSLILICVHVFMCSCVHVFMCSQYMVVSISLSSEFVFTLFTFDIHF